MLSYATNCPAADHADTAAVSLIFGSERLQLTPSIGGEPAAIQLYIASHWSKPGALRQLEAQKRTDAFIVLFRNRPQHIADRWVSTHTSYVSTTRQITQSG
jgi:hypothetical protein